MNRYLEIKKIINEYPINIRDQNNPRLRKLDICKTNNPRIIPSLLTNLLTEDIKSIISKYYK